MSLHIWWQFQKTEVSIEKTSRLVSCKFLSQNTSHHLSRYTSQNISQNISLSCRCQICKCHGFSVLILYGFLYESFIQVVQIRWSRDNPYSRSVGTMNKWSLCFIFRSYETHRFNSICRRDFHFSSKIGGKENVKIIVKWKSHPPFTFWEKRLIFSKISFFGNMIYWLIDRHVWKLN